MKQLQNLPAFSLCNAAILHALSVNSVVESGIRYLRYVSERLGLPGSHAVIVYPEVLDGETHLVFASATQLLSTKPKRLRDGVEKQNARHFRWISGSVHEVGGRFRPTDYDKVHDEARQSRISQWKARLKSTLNTSEAEEESYVLHGKLPDFYGEGFEWPDAPPEFPAAHRIMHFHVKF